MLNDFIKSSSTQPAESPSAKMRSDRSVNPQRFYYRILTNDECRVLSGHAYILDRAGDIAQVKVTSIKTWKTRPEFEVHCKYGLYEFFTIRMDPNTPNTELITLID